MREKTIPRKFLTLGKLKIVPSADIGDLGQKEGTAVVYKSKQ